MKNSQDALRRYRSGIPLLGNNGLPVACIECDRKGIDRGVIDLNGIQDGKDRRREKQKNCQKHEKLFEQGLLFEPFSEFCDPQADAFHGVPPFLCLCQ